MSKIPRLVVRIRFWLWDGQYDWLDWRDEWAERKLGSSTVDAICGVQDRVIKRPGLRLICRIWGHQPTSECHDPNHDFCLTCQKSMPGMLQRDAG